MDERHGEFVELAAALVHFRSVLGQEAEAQQFIADHLCKSGLNTEI